MIEQPESLALLTQQLSTDSLALWTDDKRKDFVATFDARVRASRYILMMTGAYVLEQAVKKHFLSEKHTKDGKLSCYVDGDSLSDRPHTRDYNTPRTIGGRSLAELGDIAKERAEEIIKQLPSLATAVRIISPEIAEKIVERDALLAKGKALYEQSKALSGELAMADLDQEMTIRAFRVMVKEREKNRLNLLNEMDEVGKEGIVLEGTINRFLYDGLPGLSDAVIKVITDFQERAIALAAFGRRVTEQVMFGDSAAALEMLKSFEKDELKISTDIKSQFDEALEKLKAASKAKAMEKPKPTKKLKAGKK